MTRPNFSSDNLAGAHPRILEAITEANGDAAPAYGDDPWTRRAEASVRELLACEASVYFVYGGTGANVLGLQAMTRPHHGIICADTAHIAVDECGAPERFTGCKLLTVPTSDGKLTVDVLESFRRRPTSQHWTVPHVVSVSQQTECGTIYTPEEIRALADCAHEAGWLVHMDGARLANAAAALGCSPAAMTTDVGVDVVSVGGTKNGMVFGEAVVFLRQELAREFANVRKQGMQLASKMRFIAVQFEILIGEGLWIDNARHANAMARRLHEGLQEGHLRLKWPCQGNALFPVLTPEIMDALQARYLFENWIPEESVARWMTSWSTTEEEVDEFARSIRALR